MLKVGSYKAFDRQLDAAQGAEAEGLQTRLDAWLASLADWTPRSRVEIVQACNIARRLIDTGDMPEDGRELAIACLVGIVRGVRTRYAPTTLALRLLPHSGASAQGFERDALAALARAAQPFRDGPCTASTAGHPQAA